jgi:predicted PurR-regulated permease PerM
MNMLIVNGWPGQELFSILGYFAIVLVLSIYWSADQLRFERISVNLFPVDMRPKALHIWRAIEKGVGSYLGSELVQGALAGLILGLGYWMIGLRYPALLGLWGAVSRLIPWFGILLAVIPLLFFGGNFLSINGLLAILFAMVVLLLLKNFIEPRLNQGSKNSLLIVLFVIILAEAFGFIGILLAPPLAVAVQIILRELYPLLAQKRYSLELQEAYRLKKRLSRVRKDIKGPAASEPMQHVNQMYQLVRQTISYMQKY